MSTVTVLASWAAELSADQIPAGVLERARAQQLSIAGAVRTAAGLPFAAALLSSTPTRGKWSLVGTTRHSSRAASVRYHAALVGALDFGDTLLWGSSTAPSVCAWAFAAKHSLSETDAAVVAANEVAGRIGAAGLLAPSSGPAWLSTQTAAAAIVTSKLLGLDAQKTGHALALALGTASRALSPTMTVRGLATAAAVQAGVDAAELAQQGAQGDLDLLDREQGYWSAHGCAHPLMGAMAGLGRSWITHTLSVKVRPGSIFTSTATDALAEVLDRHVKAADKRLRPQQWTDCRVRASWPTWAMQSAATAGLAGLPWNLATLFGALGSGHALGPEQLNTAWWEKERSDVEEIAVTVRVVHHWPHTVHAGLALLEQAAPLFSQLGIKDLQAAAARVSLSGPRLSAPRGRDELLALAKLHPGKLIPLLSRAPGDLSDMDLPAFRFTLPVDIRLSTTRGGFWPETRLTPEGGLDTLIPSALHKFAAGSAQHRERAQRLLQAPGDSLAAEWVAEL